MAQESITINGDAGFLHYFKSNPKKELISLHHGFGTWIRNHFHLWENEYTPVIDEHGIDIAEDHPDAISMKVIYRIHEILNEKK